jgi:filamentous hemagglutinin family protein
MRAFTLIAGMGAALLLAAARVPAAGPAGVKLDGTLGGAAMALAGPTYNITQNLGRLAGSNLFFSFQYFNVATGETALFSTTSGGISNVISRVTGGYASSIDGTIQLQAASGAPNFFLINPSGVTFSSNAAINVPAAFYVTTANYLKFSDGNFYADPTKISTLSSAAPEAFGFLGTTRAPVDLQGATLIGANSPAATIGVIAGDVTVDGGGNPSGIVTGPGDIRIVATGSQAIEVPLTGPVASNDGSVAIQNGALVATLGGPTEAAGNIYISGGSFLLDGANAPGAAAITGEAGGAGGGAIAIDVGGSATLVNGGLVSTFPLYGAAGGGISLNAGSLTIAGILTGLQSYTQSAANSGPIAVNVAGAATITSGGEIFSSTGAAGQAGDVTFGAGSLTLDGGPSSIFTSLGSYTTGSGNSGSVSVASVGAVSVSNDAQIGTSTTAGGEAGAVSLTASSLSVDGGLATAFTGLQTAAKPNSVGNAGALTVTTSSGVNLVNGGQILTDTAGAGNAGDITLVAGSLNIDGASDAAVVTGISSSTDSASTGNAARISVTTGGATSIINGGVIESAAYGSGNAGSVAVNASSLLIDAGPNPIATGISTMSAGPTSGSAGQIEITTSGAIQLSNGGEITSDTLSLSNAGDIAVSAGSLTIDGEASLIDTKISSNTDGGPGANAGRVSVTTGSLTIDGGTSGGFTGILSDAGVLAAAQGYLSAAGAAGTVTVKVAGTATLLNGGTISSDTYSVANAGDVNLTAGSLSLLSGSGVSTETNGLPSANGGHVTVTAGTLDVDDAVISSDSGRKFLTGGSAGTVTVTVSGAATVADGGEITSNTWSSGSAGDVTVSAGSLNINAGSNVDYFTAISSETNGTSAANAGLVVVNAGSLSIEGGGSGRAGISTDSGATPLPGFPRSGGSAGTVTVNVTGAATLTGSGTIQSNTFAGGNAGDIWVTAGSLSLDSQGSAPSEISSAAEPDSTGGSAGKVHVAVSGALSLTNGSVIQTNTYTTGAAGDVTVSAASLTINGGTANSPTGIASDSAAPSGIGGAAGTVSVTVANNMLLINHGTIASDTYTSGAGGDVSVSVGGAAQLVDFAGISSEAEAGSGGQPGAISISAGTLSLQHAVVSIENDATIADPDVLQPKQISIQAGSVRLDGAAIDAASTGNVAASAITIDYGQSLRLDSSAIATSSNEGNGGGIATMGHGPLWLSQSYINTSVSGSTNGNGGSIQINAPFIILDSGAIQANTSAPRASGGDVTIDAEALIPSFASYTLGGALQVFDGALGLNIIQAAAPNGISGSLNVTVPTLDLGNALLRLTGAPAAPTPLGRGACRYRPGSSLALAGRGGLPVSARQPLWFDIDDSATDAPDDASPGPINAQAADPVALALIACR